MTLQNENSASHGPRSTDEAPVARPSGIEAAVCEDIARRQALGIAKYGTTVADNPLELRAWLQHAYEECLDQAVYLRRAIDELDRRGLCRPVVVNRAKPLQDFITSMGNRLADLVKQAHEVAPPGEWGPPERRKPAHNDELPPCTQAVDHSNNPDHP